jgi:hypothetical protein
MDSSEVAVYTGACVSVRHNRKVTPMAEKAPKRNLTVEVTLRPQKGVEAPNARVYLFDRDGKLVESKPVGGSQLKFQLTDERRHRLLVGPDIAVTGLSHAELAAELARSEVISRDVLPKAGLDVVKLEIPPSIYRCWWKTCIYVHGSVRKQTAPGVYAPICTGVVQIFQVDLGCTLDNLASFTDAPKWYALLVDVLGGLERAELAQRIRLIPNLPDPPPESLHETHVPRQTTQRMSASQTVLTSERVVMADSASAPSVGAGPKASSAAELANTLKALPQRAVKDAILANKAIIAPFLCWLIPDAWFCWQELGEATIQSDGTFSAEICFWCPEDFPDLYFEVIQTIGGIEREISDPQIACSTYYNYDGTEDVTITVEDPDAVACNDPKERPIEGEEYYVWPTAIGNIDLRNITGLEEAPGGPPQGLVGANPWGGSLALQMQFDPRLKSDGIASYYRWSYKFDGDANFSPVSAPVNHRYMTLTFAPLQIHLHTVNLGPYTVGTEQNLFEVPDPYPGDGWVNINDPYDRPFGYFDSTDNHYSPFSYTDTLPRRSGMCTLLLEMFDAAGKLVPCANDGVGGPFEFVLPELSGPPTEYTSVLGPNNITPEGQLVFRVLIDNHDTSASIDSVSAAGHTADKCGMLHYKEGSDDVAISFHATHPSDYLTWSLGVNLGFYGGVASESGSSSSPPAPENPLVRDASELLHGCTNGAFAVNLYTAATATDGYARQSQYDRSASVAFALLNP